MHMNNRPTENFQNSDHDNLPRSIHDFLGESVVDMMRRLPDLLNRGNEFQQDVGASLGLPTLDFVGGGSGDRGDDYGRGNNYGGRGDDYGRRDDYGRGDDYAAPDDYADGDSERTPFNRKELGARLILDNFEDIDVNGDNRVSAKEIRRFARDEVQSDLEKGSLSKVLDEFKAVKRLAKDGSAGGASEKDLQRFAKNQVDKGILRRYPG